YYIEHANRINLSHESVQTTLGEYRQRLTEGISMVAKAMTTKGLDGCLWIPPGYQGAAADHEFRVDGLKIVYQFGDMKAAETKTLDQLTIEELGDLLNWMQTKLSQTIQGVES